MHSRSDLVDVGVIDYSFFLRPRGGHDVTAYVAGFEGNRRSPGSPGALARRPSCIAFVDRARVSTGKAPCGSVVRRCHGNRGMVGVEKGWSSNLAGDFTPIELDCSRGPERPVLGTGSARTVALPWWPTGVA